MINKPTYSFIIHEDFTWEVECWYDGGPVDDHLVGDLVDQHRPELLGQSTIKAGAADEIQTPLGAQTGVTLLRGLRGAWTWCQ